MKFEGKTIVVTGASSGMGDAIAQLLALKGATVIAVARRENRLNELKEKMKDASGKIIPFVGDISLQKTNEDMIDLAVKETGKLDVLVNNAGVMDEFIPVGELTNEFWARIIDVNLTGPMYAMRKAIQVFQQQGNGGNIINIASVGGLNGCRAGAAYTAAKHAMVGLSKNTAFMYAKENIRCNVVCPGAVATEVAVGCSNPSPAGVQRATAGVGLSPRMGTSEEIAHVVSFLAADGSSLLNGAVITADSGWTAY